MPTLVFVSVTHPEASSSHVCDQPRIMASSSDDHHGGTGGTTMCSSGCSVCSCLDTQPLALNSHNLNLIQYPLENVFQAAGVTSLMGKHDLKVKKFCCMAESS